MQEVWKDIPGYEGAYQASSLGRVKSLDRVIEQKGRWGNIVRRTLRGKMLSPGRYCANGHVSVVLKRGTNGVAVHRLVAITFLGPIPEGNEVRHKNGIPNDNRLENLEYGTRTENILDVYKQGKSWRKLSVKDVQDIRKLLEQNMQGSKIAKIYGVSEHCISAIKNRRTYAWM